MSNTPEGSHEHHETGEGAKRLHELEKSGKYVFHGSPTSDIAELEARQPYDWTDGVKTEDGPPCVAATQFADIAIFRALVTEDHTGFGQTEKRELHFEASQKALDTLKGRTGFVYVLLKSQFAPRHRDDQEMEWRSATNQNAIQIIQVTDHDLPRNIEITPPRETTRLDALHNEAVIERILVSGSDEELKELQQAHDKTDEQIKYYRYWARVRKSATEPLPHTDRPMTPEEENIGIHLDYLEPQVVEAIRTLSNKGYKTTYSGFSKLGSAQIIRVATDQFDQHAVSEETKNLIKDKWGINIELSPRQIEFDCPGTELDLDDLTKIWNIIADNLPSV